MVYGADRGLRYAVFTGSGFSISPIAGTTVPSPPSDSTVVLDSTPELAMDANDKAHLVWTRTWEEQAACGRAPANAIGTYYATNASGVWKVARITRAVGETSLQVDQKTGRVHVVMSGKKLRYYTTAGNGRWSGSTVTSVSASSPLLRLDPATGTLLIVYLGGSGGSRIYAMTKP